MRPMAEVHAQAQREIPAPPGAVVAFLRDLHARPRILTDNWSDFHVRDGGEGAGTVIAYRFSTGRREREYLLTVEEAGTVLRERDQRSSFVTTWTVQGAGDGRSTVTLESSWRGAGGIGGFFERRFAPAGLGRIYAQVLDRLAAEPLGPAA